MAHSAVKSRGKGIPPAKKHSWETKFEATQVLYSSPNLKWRAIQTILCCLQASYSERQAIECLLIVVSGVSSEPHIVLAFLPKDWFDNNAEYCKCGLYRPNLSLSLYHWHCLKPEEFEQLAFDYLNLSDDHSRVILQPVEDDPSSDYINANYIDVSVLPGCFPRAPTISAPVWELDACYYLWL